MAADQNNMTGQNGMGSGSSGYGGMSGQMQGGSAMHSSRKMQGGMGEESSSERHMSMGHKAKKMKIYKQMCEKAVDRMSALFGQSVEPHEMTKALLMAVKKGSPEEVVSAIEIFSDYRWAVNEKKELAEEFDSSEEED